MRLVDGGNFQDLYYLVLLADLVEHRERSPNMQSIQLEFQMQQLFIASPAWEWVHRKGVAFILNEPLALFWKL